MVHKPPFDHQERTVYRKSDKGNLNLSPDSLIWCTQKSLQEALSIGDKKRAAECYSFLGINEKHRRNFQASLGYHLNALKINKYLNDEYALASTHNELGTLYQIAGRIDDALKHYVISNHLYRKVDKPKGVATTYNNIGTVYRQKKNPDSALHYYRLGLEQFVKMDDSCSIAACLSKMGDSYVQSGRYAEALEYFLRCLQYNKAHEDPRSLVISYNNVSHVLSTLKRLDEATRYSDSAIALAAAENVLQERSEAYFIRATIEEWKGEYKEGLSFHRKAVELKDSLISEEVNRQLSDLQTKYERAIKDKQIFLQHAETKNKYLLTGIVGLMSFAVLLSYSVRRYTLRQQTNFTLRGSSGIEPMS